MENLKELNKQELLLISGGGKAFGFVLGAYVDFEIGMAKGIWNSVVKAWNAL